MTDRNTEADPERGTSQEAAPDVESDPARDDRIGSDWSDEGGAAPDGPATSTRSDDSEADGEADDGEQDSEQDGARLLHPDEVVGPQITLDPPD